MKLCCGNGKPYDSLTEFERLGACGNDHCVGPISVEDFDLLLTGLGTFNPEDCISSDDLWKVVETQSDWNEWMNTQIALEGVEKYKSWYARMSERCDLHPELIEAHNKLFGEK